jgi:cell division septum initiation protein DivIVA
MSLDANAVPGSSTTSNPSSTQPASGSLSRQPSTPASRRASQISPMGPPPLPLASPGGTILPSASHGHAFPPLSPGPSGYVQTSVDAAGVPMRHPHPMTAAEMHLELEKEQEAVVNRLTRELSALRAHSASVASTTSMSSAADSSVAPVDGLTGHMHPTSSRRHRSSSSLSRSASHVPHRYSVSSQPAAVTSDPTQNQLRDHRSSSVLSTPRYEEVAQHKAELEEVKKENEALKQRIRDLERQIKGGGAGAAADRQRGRSGAPVNEDKEVPVAASEDS